MLSALTNQLGLPVEDAEADVAGNRFEGVRLQRICRVSGLRRTRSQVLDEALGGLVVRVELERAFQRRHRFSGCPPAAGLVRVVILAADRPAAAQDSRLVGNSSQAVGVSSATLGSVVTLGATFSLAQAFTTGSNAAGCTLGSMMNRCP